MSEKSMMIINSDWYGHESFRLIPINETTPFVEVIYDPRSETLAVISKALRDKPQMMPKLNDKGEMVALKGSTPEKPMYAEERRMVPAYYEYYISNKKDIEYFISHFAANDTRNALKRVNTPSVESGIAKAETPSIILNS
jgi:hypothetical protein